MHARPVGMLTDVYPEQEYFEDLMQVTEGKTDETLLRLTIRESEQCLEWMTAHGVHFQPSLSGTLSLSRTNAFFLGGGKALVNAYYLTAARLGVEVQYDTEVSHVHLEGGRFEHAVLSSGGKTFNVRAKSLVVASGGFQADTDWLVRAWGPAAGNFLIRGTPYNRGRLLSDLLAQGAEPVGDPTQCHAVAIDARAPRFDGGIVTRLDCVPFSIVVNREAQRFYDEGEDVWPKRYAIWGRLVAQQPGQIAYALIDSTSLELFMPSVYPPVAAATLDGIATELELDAQALKQTVETFNASCRTGTFKPTELDGLATEGLDPPKTNWARPIEEPPFYAYPLRPGVTFTYLGLRVDETARVRMANVGPSHNVWAAGEVMAGNILGQGYTAGIGMTIGTVFGRIAGEEAARHALG